MPPEDIALGRRSIPPATPGGSFGGTGSNPSVPPFMQQQGQSRMIDWNTGMPMQSDFERRQQELFGGSMATPQQLEQAKQQGYDIFRDFADVRKTEQKRAAEFQKTPQPTVDNFFNSLMGIGGRVGETIMNAPQAGLDLATSAIGVGQEFLGAINPFTGQPFEKRIEGITAPMRATAQTLYSPIEGVSYIATGDEQKIPELYQQGLEFLVKDPEQLGESAMMALEAYNPFNGKTGEERQELLQRSIDELYKDGGAGVLVDLPRVTGDGVYKTAVGIGKIAGTAPQLAGLLFSDTINMLSGDYLTKEQIAERQDMQMELLEGMGDLLNGPLEAVFPVRAVTENVEVPGLEGLGAAVNHIANVTNYLTGTDPNSRKGKAVSNALMGALGWASFGFSGTHAAKNAGRSGAAKAAAGKTAAAKAINTSKIAKGMQSIRAQFYALGDDIGRWGDDVLDKIDDAYASYFKTKPLKVTKAPKPPVKELIVEGSKVGGKAGGQGSKLLKEMVSKASGTQFDDLTRIYQQPQLYDQFRKGLLSADDLADDIYRQIQHIDDLQKTTGAAWQPLRQSGQTVKMGTSLKDLFKSKFGLVDDPATGLLKMKQGGASGIRSTSDLAKINKLITTYGDDVLDANRALNLIDDLDGISKWDSLVKKSDQLMGGTRVVKSQVSDIVKKALPEYKSLATKYKELKNALDPIKAKLIDKQTGFLKPTVSGRDIVALTNKSYKFALDKLDEVMPGIADKVQMARVYNNIEKALGSQAGQYVRSGGMMGTAGMAMTGNVPGAAIAGVGTAMSNPAIVARTASWLGKNGIKLPKIGGGIKSATKAAAGKVSTGASKAGQAAVKQAFNAAKTATKVGAEAAKGTAQIIGDVAAAAGQAAPQIGQAARQVAPIAAQAPIQKVRQEPTMPSMYEELIANLEIADPTLVKRAQNAFQAYQKEFLKDKYKEYMVRRDMMQDKGEWSKNDEIMFTLISQDVSDGTLNSFLDALKQDLLPVPVKDFILEVLQYAESQEEATDMLDTLHRMFKYELMDLQGEADIQRDENLINFPAAT